MKNQINEVLFNIDKNNFNEILKLLNDFKIKNNKESIFSFLFKNEIKKNNDFINETFNTLLKISIEKEWFEEIKLLIDKNEELEKKLNNYIYQNLQTLIKENKNILLSEFKYIWESKSLVALSYALKYENSDFIIKSYDKKSILKVPTYIAEENLSIYHSLDNFFNLKDEARNILYPYLYSSNNNYQKLIYLANKNNNKEKFLLELKDAEILSLNNLFSHFRICWTPIYNLTDDELCKIIDEKTSINERCDFYIFLCEKESFSFALFIVKGFEKTLIECKEKNDEKNTELILNTLNKSKNILEKKMASSYKNDEEEIKLKIKNLITYVFKIELSNKVMINKDVKKITNKI